MNIMYNTLSVSTRNSQTNSTDLELHPPKHSACCSSESWKQIPQYPHYSVSSCGRARNTTRLISISVPPRGYRVIHLNGKTHALHRVVLQTFIGPRPPGKWACHNDGNQSNNHLSNLRWATPKDNFRDRDKHGNTSRGSHRPTAKLTESDIPHIRWLYLEGIKTKNIAEAFSVNQSTISRILSGTTWRHVRCFE